VLIERSIETTMWINALAVKEDTEKRLKNHKSRDESTNGVHNAT
jgi:hypothetical protein